MDALAHLQLARALALSGDTVKAKSAYSDLLTLWKNADADIPVLKEAGAEYARLPYAAFFAGVEPESPAHWTAGTCFAPALVSVRDLKTFRDLTQISAHSC
jgi:hypothetical protein